MLLVVLVYYMINADVKKTILSSVRKESDLDDNDSNGKMKEKESLDCYKARDLNDSKPIIITLKDHKIEDFINDLEKAVF